VAHIFTAGPKGPIVVIGDSLTVGTAAQTARALRGNGWGPICIDATVSRTVEFGSRSTPDGLDAAARIKASDPVWNDPTITWVVALGTNDVGNANGNVARSDQFVADQIAAIGPNPIWWMNVRTDRPDSQDREAVFNQSITASGVGVIDWHSAADGQHWMGGDRVHLTNSGYQARADLLAATVRPR
jgi:lysophospholipase L1-like esterase